MGCKTVGGGGGDGSGNIWGDAPGGGRGGGDLWIGKEPKREKSRSATEGEKSPSFEKLPINGGKKA